jgi:hypothetical protein
MFWPILATSAAAIGLIELGRLSVLVIFLSMTVKLLLALLALGIVGGVGYVVWRKYGQRQASPKGMIEGNQ